MYNKKTDRMTWKEITQDVAERTGKTADKKFIEWYTGKEPLGYMFDPTMIKWCYKIQKDLLDDFDHFMVISGREGLGKSTFAIQVAALLHPNSRPFTLDYLGYSASQFIKALKEAPKGSCIILDEGGQSLFSREAMTLTNRMLVKTFMVMRQRNLCVIVCIPNFHLLDSYIKLHRVNSVIEIIQRGKYMGIIGSGVKTVAQDGAKYKNILGLPINRKYSWFGYFNKEFPKTISRDEYTKVKEDNMIEFLDKLEEDNDFTEIKMVPVGKAAKEIMCDARKFIKMIQDKDIEGKKIGNNWYMSKKAYKNLIKSK